MDTIRVSDRDASDPKMLRQHLNALFAQSLSLLQRIEQLERDLRLGVGTVGGITEQERGLLRSIAIGSTENPIASQTPVVPTVSAFPPVNASVGGQLVRLSSDGVLYIFDSSTKSWVDILSAAPANMLTTDTDQVVAAGVNKTWTDVQAFTGGLTSGAQVKVTAGGIDVDAGGVNIDAGGLTVAAGTTDIAGRLDAGAELLLTGVALIAFASSPYDVPANVFEVLANTSGGAITVNLTASPATDRYVLIKDGTGNAGANNITVDGGAANIDGAATKTISTNFGALLLKFNGPDWGVYGIVA